jgi:radical SAM superfamily enzyme with C-terminal helix-hairpin-helix motif
MSFLISRGLAIFAVFATLVACTGQNPQDLKEKTARATVEMKRDAKAVAAGIREGWSRDKPLDVNTAAREQLVTLPGLNGHLSDRIIAGRPYQKPDDLVSRHILSRAEYSRIADLITVKK